MGNAQFESSVIDGVLLDIEGTTSSIAFVYDKMFPFVKEHLKEFLKENWESESLRDAIRQIAIDAGLSDWPDPSPSTGQAQVHDEVTRQMDADIKATGLKKLQGQIWKSGFESGSLKAQVFADVRPAISAWKQGGLDIRIYSSGSVQAQKLFFGYTVEGNLLPFFSGHYDTEIGGKKEKSSYLSVAEDWGLPPEKILFVSDVLEELDAAKSAGLKTVLSLRPGNREIECSHDHPAVSSFESIQIG